MTPRRRRAGGTAEIRTDINPLWFLGATVRSALHYPGNAVGLGVRAVINQTRFTAVQALPLLIFVAALVSLPMSFGAMPFLADLGVAGTVEGPLLSILVGELGPAVAALLVVARSGTAVAAELAATRVTGEREALEALGVDTLQYYVLPRIVAFAASVALLAVFFDLVVVGTMMIGHAQQGLEIPFQSVIRQALTGGDILFILGKAVLFGVGIAVLSAMEGLEAGDSPVAIPIAVSRGTVQSFLWVFVVTALVAGFRYLG